MDYNEMMEKLRKRIIKRREIEGVSQAQLAKMIGRTRSTVSAIETGKHDISMDYAYSVCEALEIPFHDLFRGLGSFVIVRNSKAMVQDLRTMSAKLYGGDR